MSAQGGNDDPNQPRQPRSLQGLLKFAMEGKVDSRTLLFTFG